ncbi:hypothetical protein G7Z17_g3329 [Cylindrodendrum hubeiense]|uniref:Uncharacterized protein n=1 Tax=Cylindrodendrum hubeiense TaxID=595255 RepID=A0A9P5LDP1_9HYPO|nr:hypothetical protein G7Z17_g3329 [Cylindrodendrum hubeiense]
MAGHGEFNNFVSIIRLSFKPSARDKVDVSPEWYKTMVMITKEPNFRYVARGEGVDDTCDLMLMVGWIDGTNPSAAFQSTATSTSGPDSLLLGSSGLDKILSPLQAFLSQRFRALTLSHNRDEYSPTLLTTTFRGVLWEPMREVLTIRGHVRLVEPGVKAIETTLDDYILYREGARFSDASKALLFNGVTMARLDHNNYGSSGEHDELATFALILTWSNREGRTRFQDPTLPDLTLTPGMRLHYPFWHEKVTKPLQALVEQGATVSSWDYHKADLVQNKKGIPMVHKGEKPW